MRSVVGTRYLALTVQHQCIWSGVGPSRKTDVGHKGRGCTVRDHVTTVHSGGRTVELNTLPGMSSRIGRRVDAVGVRSPAHGRAVRSNAACRRVADRENSEGTGRQGRLSSGGLAPTGERLVSVLRAREGVSTRHGFEGAGRWRLPAGEIRAPPAFDGAVQTQAAGLLVARAHVLQGGCPVETILLR